MSEQARLTLVGGAAASCARIRALTLWQPWASLWMAGPKRFETRDWPTSVRGWLAVHAAARPVCTDVDDDLRNLLCHLFGTNWATSLPRGAVLGIGRLSRCISTQAFDPDALEQLCGNWMPNRFAFRLDDRRALDVGIPARGLQGFWWWHPPAAFAHTEAGRALALESAL